MFDSQGNFLFHGQDWRNHKYIRKEGNRYIYPEDVKNSNGNGMPSNVGRNTNSGSRNASKAGIPSSVKYQRQGHLRLDSDGSNAYHPYTGNVNTAGGASTAVRESLKGKDAERKSRRNRERYEAGQRSPAQTEMKKGLAANERKKHAASNSATASEQMKRGKAAVSKVVKDTRKPGNHDVSGTLSVWPGARMNKVVDRKGKEKTNYPGGAGAAATEYRKALVNAFYNNKMDPETEEAFLKLYGEDMEIEEYNRYEDKVRENERKRRNTEKKISDTEKEINKRKKKR